MFFFVKEQILVRRFLFSVNEDVERAKKLIELNYTLRFKNPNIFSHRDPMDDGIQRAMKMM